MQRSALRLDMTRTRFDRPMEVKYLAGIFIGISIWHAIRLISALVFRDTFNYYPFTGGFSYLVISGVCWAIIWLVLTISIWLGTPWARKASIGTAIGLFLWLILDTFMLQGPGTTAWCQLSITSILLLFSTVLLISHNLRDYEHDKK
jgi:hypothetical protein